MDRDGGGKEGREKRHREVSCCYYYLPMAIQVVCPRKFFLGQLSRSRQVPAVNGEMLWPFLGGGIAEVKVLRRRMAETELKKVAAACWGGRQVPASEEVKGRWMSCNPRCHEADEPGRSLLLGRDWTRSRESTPVSPACLFERLSAGAGDEARVPAFYTGSSPEADQQRAPVRAKLATSSMRRIRAHVTLPSKHHTLARAHPHTRTRRPRRDGR